MTCQYLSCAAFGWQQAANSVKGYDATDRNGVKYQIKGRRTHRRNKSRQLSAIRDLNGFDVLAVVLFDDDYQIVRVALVPIATVRDNSVYVQHTNSNKFIAKESLWDIEGVNDVTDRLRAMS